MVQHQIEAAYRKEHGVQQAVLTTPEDVDALIDWLLTGPLDHSLAQLHSAERPRLPSGYRDHELLVGVDRDLRVGALRFMDPDGNVMTLGPLDGRTEVKYFLWGHGFEFLPYCEVPLDHIREAVKEFLSSGGMRPTCVDWQVSDF